MFHIEVVVEVLEIMHIKCLAWGLVFTALSECQYLQSDSKDKKLPDSFVRWHNPESMSEMHIEKKQIISLTAMMYHFLKFNSLLKKYCIWLSRKFSRNLRTFNIRSAITINNSLHHSDSPPFNLFSQLLPPAKKRGGVNKIQYSLQRKGSL